LKLTNIKLNNGRYGIIALPIKNSLLKDCVGCFINSWAYAIHHKRLELGMDNKKSEFIPYGNNVISGDFLTIRIDMTNEGIL
jgi:hypothetical protein